MEAQEVCAKQIYTKLHHNHFLYNLLELGHGADPWIMFLVGSHTNLYGMVQKYINEVNICTSIPMMALYKTQKNVIQYHLIGVRGVGILVVWYIIQ